VRHPPLCTIGSINPGMDSGVKVFVRRGDFVAGDSAAIAPPSVLQLGLVNDPELADRHLPILL
jgi:hypothetical protein